MITKEFRVGCGEKFVLVGFLGYQASISMVFVPISYFFNDEIA